MDYVESDDGHQWLAPSDDEMLISFYMPPQTLRIAQALYRTGMTTADGLAIVAKIWRQVDVHLEFRWDEAEAKNKKTLDELERNGLLNPDCGNVYWNVVREWPMPLYTLDLRRLDVDREKLEETRERWRPD